MTIGLGSVDRSEDLLAAISEGLTRRAAFRGAGAKTSFVGNITGSLPYILFGGHDQLLITPQLCRSCHRQTGA